MRGMDCWSSAYENSQGLAGLEQQLQWLQEQYPHAKDWYDELNADNLKKEREAAAVAFAESAKKTRKMTNKMAELEGLFQIEQAILDGMEDDGSEAYTDQQLVAGGIFDELN